MEIETLDENRNYFLMIEMTLSMYYNYNYNRISVEILCD